MLTSIGLTPLFSPYTYPTISSSQYYNILHPRVQPIWPKVEEELHMRSEQTKLRGFASCLQICVTCIFISFFFHSATLDHHSILPFWPTIFGFFFFQGHLGLCSGKRLILFLILWSSSECHVKTTGHSSSVLPLVGSANQDEQSATTLLTASPPPCPSFLSSAHLPVCCHLLPFSLFAFSNPSSPVSSFNFTFALFSVRLPDVFWTPFLNSLWNRSVCWAGGLLVLVASKEGVCYILRLPLCPLFRHSPSPLYIHLPRRLCLLTLRPGDLGRSRTRRRSGRRTCVYADVAKRLAKKEDPHFSWLLIDLIGIKCLNSNIIHFNSDRSLILHHSTLCLSITRWHEPNCYSLQSTHFFAFFVHSG